MYVLVILIIILFLPQAYYLWKNKNYRDIYNNNRVLLDEEVKLSDNISDISIIGADGFSIKAKKYHLDNPKAVVQIVHGMLEHKENYIDFIEYLRDKGYAVFIEDNRGHGRSVSEKYPAGFIGHTDELIFDQYCLNSYIRKIYPGKKIYMVGHSMGSMIARDFLMDYDKFIDKLVLSGTVAYIPISGFGVFLGNILCFYLGEKRKSIILDKLSGIDLNDSTWISYNEENVNTKRQDSLRLKRFLAKANTVLFDLNWRLARVNRYKNSNKDLKILSVTGVDDPVTGGQKGLRKTVELLKKNGYRDIENIVYPNMKHEVLNENNKNLVYDKIIEFFEN